MSEKRALSELSTLEKLLLALVLLLFAAWATAPWLSALIGAM